MELGPVPRACYIRAARTSFSHRGHPALCAHPSGLVQCNHFGDGHTSEQWRVHVLEWLSETSARIGLRSHYDQWLTAFASGHVLADRETLGEFEQWTLERCANGKWALRSAHGYYLTCHGHQWLGTIRDRVTAHAPVRQSWEHFLISYDSAEHTQPATGWCPALIVAVVAIAVLAGAVAVPLLGFGTAGVTKGSLAALWQSVAYKGGTAGMFAFLQSIGAKRTWQPVALTAALVAFVFGGGAAYALRLAHQRILRRAQGRRRSSRLIDSSTAGRCHQVACSKLTAQPRCWTQTWAPPCSTASHSSVL